MYIVHECCVWYRNDCVCIPNSISGNILGALIVSALLPYGFEYAMMGGSVMLLLGGVVILVCLTEHPHRVGKCSVS